MTIVRRVAIRCMALIVVIIPVCVLHAAEFDDGKALYDGLCQTCHGLTGAGDGPGSAGFALQPRPFSQAAFKFDTDSDWEKGTDADLAAVIRNGAGTYGGSAMMPPWPTLSDVQIENLIAYIRSFQPARLPTDAGFSEIYQLLDHHCGDCHVQGIADGPWSLNTPPDDQRFPECLGSDEYTQLRCATYHQLVDAPGPGITAWIRPDNAPASEPYVEACDSTASFHIGQSLPEGLPEHSCAMLLAWIRDGARY